MVTKKGAMDIGIGTIVILVIAMVVIGGMIMFINNFLTDAEQQLGKTFEEAGALGLDVSANDPLAFGSLQVQSGETTTLEAAVYNQQSTEMANVTIDVNRCATEDGTIGNIEPDLFTLPQNIGATDDAAYQLSLRGVNASNEQDLDAGTYICNIEATALEGEGETLASDQITIEVTS